MNLIRGSCEEEEGGSRRLGDRTLAGLGME
jgi:hypothetical protein